MAYRSLRNIPQQFADAWGFFLNIPQFEFRVGSKKDATRARQVMQIWRSMYRAEIDAAAEDAAREALRTGIPEDPETVTMRQYSRTLYDGIELQLKEDATGVWSVVRNPIDWKEKLAESVARSQIPGDNQQ